MALIGEMKYLTIGGKTYQISVPESGSSVEFTPNLTSGTKVGDLTIDDSTVSLYAPTNTDTKLQIGAVTSGTTYYPVVAANSTTAATRQYDATGLAYAGANGTTSAVGTAKITLGNSTASGTANNKKGQITLYGSTVYATTIDPGSPTAARTITLPNATGTVALTSDIPTISYPVTSVNTKTGAVSLTASDVGAAASSHAHGNITSGGDITATAPTIASGDQIIINDNSASKITNGPTFDGSTTTTALTPKGTWETFSKFSGSYNDLSNKPTIPTKTSDLTNDAGYTTNTGTVTGVKINGSTKSPTSGVVDLGTFATSDTNTTYSLSNALLSHKFTSTLTAGGSGSGTSTASIELVAGTGITLTDDTTNKKITIASSVTNTDTKVTNTAVTDATTNYLVGSTSAFTTTGTLSKHASAYIYTTADSTTDGYTQFVLGNTTATSSAGGKEGRIQLYGTNATYYAYIRAGSQTYNHTITLPDASGTVALTSNIPSITLNGSSTTSPNFYAPTSVGTNGYYLKSNGSGAPSWSALPTIPSAGTSASAVGTTASGGTASTYSKSDHVHNITGTTITTALGYTPGQGQTTVQIVRW